MNEILLKTRKLAIGYRRGEQQRLLADDIEIGLRSGELYCLVGPNGAGKTTLLRTLAGILPALDGQVLIHGLKLKYDAADTEWMAVQRLSPRQLAKRISIVLTEKVEVGYLSAYALVALGRYPYTDWSGRLTRRDEEVIHWALQAVDATNLEHRSIHELSDGERQKVFIARALAQEPDIMILDEPTAFLDLPHRVEIMHSLRNLARSLNQAILMSTHDLDLALRMADKLWMLPLGGKLEEGAPEDLVLSGAMERAFGTLDPQRKSAEFDRRSGTFNLASENGKSISLKGEGLTATWTARALRRAGYRVVHSRSEKTKVPLIDIKTREGESTWQLYEEQKMIDTFYSIAEMMDFFRFYKNGKHDSRNI